MFITVFQDFQVYQKSENFLTKAFTFTVSSFSLYPLKVIPAPFIV